MILSSQKLLVVADELKTPRAGTERQMLLLLDRLMTSGCKIHVVLLRRTPFSMTHDFPFPVTQLPAGRMSSPDLWWALIRIARSLRSDGFRTALTFFNDASIVAPPVLRTCGYRTFVSRRDMGWWCRGSVRICTRLARPFVHKWIANAQAVKSATVQLERCNAEAVEVIPNAVVVKEPLPAIDETSLRDRPIRLGVIANITRHKRIDDVILAVAGLRNRNFDVSLQVAGSLAKEPDTVHALRDTIARCGLMDHAELLGDVRDIRSFLQQTHVSILASESEGSSNALLESMAHGRVVVCSSADGNREIITDEITGKLFAVADVQALERALEDCIARPGHAAELARNAQRMVLESFSEDASMRRWIKTLFGSSTEH